MHRDVHRETHRDRQTVDQLLAQLQASEHDKFAAAYWSRLEYRLDCDHAEKAANRSSGA
jgi:hypothetical protein